MSSAADGLPTHPPFLAAGPAAEVLAGLRHAPQCPVPTLIGDGAVLVVAPHADDETLGCGGLMRTLVRLGRRVLIDILTDGARSHPGSAAYPPMRLAMLRREEARQAAGALGLDAELIDFHDQPDGYLGRDAHAAADLVVRLADRIDREGVSAVFVTCAADPHPDHQAAFALARRAVRQSRRGASTGVARLFAYPIWVWTETGEVSLGTGATGAHRIDISGELSCKRRATDCYASQLGRVIEDSPAGFRLTEEHLALFLKPDEVFVGFEP